MLQQYAGHLNSIRWRRWFARPFYEVMSDAIVWTGETNKVTPVRLIWALRPVFHYRTGLILGEQRRFPDEWQLGLKLFPRWVGFHPSHCRPSPRLAEIYRVGKAALQRDLEKLDNNLNA
jgi:hypothetical protein